jgi:hypothetical protein
VRRKPRSIILKKLFGVRGWSLLFVRRKEKRRKKKTGREKKHSSLFLMLRESKRNAAVVGPIDSSY